MNVGTVAFLMTSKIHPRVAGLGNHPPLDVEVLEAGVNGFVIR